MLHAAVVALVLVAACGAGDDDSLLSTSRLSLREGERATVQVDAASFTVDFSPELEDLRIVPGASSFTVEPSCNAAPGMDTTIPITIRSGGRTATLVVAVIDDAGPDCLADIAIWEEPCTADTCHQACGPKPAIIPARFDFDRESSHRICVHSVQLDHTRVISPELTIEPDTSAFTDRETHRIIVRGHEWLVGPYEVVFRVRSGDTVATRRVPMIIGKDGDVGIEMDPKPFMPQELARTLIPVVVHRNGNQGCSVRVPMSSGLVDVPFAARLYAGNADTEQFVDYGTGGSLPCTEEAHVRFTFSVVPKWNALATIPDVRLFLDREGQLDALGRIFDLTQVTSRVEQLTPDQALCGTTLDRLACGDIDNNGSLEIVIGDGTTSCITSLPGFRHSPAEGYHSTGSAIDHMFALPSSPPQIYGADTSERLAFLDPTTSPNPTWQPKGTVGKRVTAVQTTASGGLDRWVGIAAGKSLHISNIEATEGHTVTLPTTDTSFVALDVIGVGSGPQRLVVVGTAAGGYKAYLLTVANWAAKPPVFLPLVPELHLIQMPPNATVRLATRVRGNQHDVVASFLTGAFENAGVEMQVSDGGFSEITRYGGLRSVASANGPALLGAATGAQETQVLNDEPTYRSIDPLATPSLTYGNGIAPCFDGAGKLVGYAVNAGPMAINAPDRVRVSRIGVTLETP